MLFALIVSSFVAVFYIVYSMIKAKGVPESVSATYYILEDEGWIFQCVIGSIAALLLPVWLEVTEPWRQWTAFVTCSSMVFVAMAPSFRMELQGAIHYSAAVICCISAVSWQVLEGLWDVTLWFAWLGGMLAVMWKEQWCWWIELSVIGSLLCNLFRTI